MKIKINKKKRNFEVGRGKKITIKDVAKIYLKHNEQDTNILPYNYYDLTTEKFKTSENIYTDLYETESILYNDISVLEQYHSACGFQAMSFPNCGHPVEVIQPCLLFMEVSNRSPDHQDACGPAS